LLAPQRGLFANVKKSKQKTILICSRKSFCPNLKRILPELSNSASPPAELGVYLRLIKLVKFVRHCNLPAEIEQAGYGHHSLPLLRRIAKALYAEVFVALVAKRAA